MIKAHSEKQLLDKQLKPELVLIKHEPRTNSKLPETDLYKTAIEEEKKKHLEIDADTWKVVCDLQY